MVPLADLRPYAKITRLHGEDQLKALEAVIRDSGLTAPLIIDPANDRLCATICFAERRLVCGPKTHPARPGIRSIVQTLNFLEGRIWIDQPSGKCRLSTVALATGALS